MKRWDVILIGSGISSLTCAALLAKKGKSVCVLEKYSKPGGYLHCFSRFGERYDTGAHYVGALGRGQSFYTLLKYLDVYQEDHFIELNRDGFDVFKYPEFQFEFPQGYAETIQRLSEYFPTEKAGIETYYEKIQQAVRHFPSYEFNSDLETLELLKYMEISLKQVVESVTRNPKLQALLYGYCALHGVMPEDVPFGLHAILTDSLVRGAYGLAQGGDVLAQKYVQAIRKNGGEVYLRKEVKQIEVKDKIAQAVLTQDGERFEADWVISGIHPKMTYQLVSEPEVFSKAFKERLEKMKESPGLFGIYTTCAQSAGLHPLKNYYYFSSLDPQIAFGAESPDRAPGGLFLCPAKRELNSDDPFSLSILSIGRKEWFEKWQDTRYGKRAPDYQVAKQTYAERIFEMLGSYEEKFQPGKYVTSTPLTNMHFNPSPEGSSYGIYHSMQNTGARALGPRTHVANLLLTGQNCLFPGLLGSAISAVRTSGHIIGMKPMLRELRSFKQTL